VGGTALAATEQGERTSIFVNQAGVTSGRSCRSSKSGINPVVSRANLRSEKTHWGRTNNLPPTTRNQQTSCIRSLSFWPVRSDLLVVTCSTARETQSSQGNE